MILLVAGSTAVDRRRVVVDQSGMLCVAVMSVCEKGGVFFMYSGGWICFGELTTTGLELSAQKMGDLIFW